MLTIEDVEETIVALHERNITQFDGPLRRDAYKECGYCESVRALAFAKSEKERRMPVFHR